MDEDGCVMRIIYSDNKHGTRKIAESLLTIEDTASSKKGLAFQRVGTAITSGSRSSSGYLSGEDTSTVWSIPSSSIRVTNYLPKECGEKDDGAPFEGGLVNILVGENIEASVVIFDN